MELISQKMRSLAPELDPLRLGTGWKPEDLAKPQIIVESTFGDSHPGSGHLDKLVAAACEGVAQAGGHGARYFATDICDGESQGTDGINFSLASREMIANMIEIHANATPFDGGVYIASCDKGLPANLMGLARVNIPAVMITGGTMHAGPDLLTLEQLGMYSMSAAKSAKKSWTGPSRMPVPVAAHAVSLEQRQPCRLWQRLWAWHCLAVLCFLLPVRILCSMHAALATRP